MLVLSLTSTLAIVLSLASTGSAVPAGSSSSSSSSSATASPPNAGGTTESKVPSVLYRSDFRTPKQLKQATGIASPSPSRSGAQMPWTDHIVKSQARTRPNALKGGDPWISLQASQEVARNVDRTGGPHYIYRIDTSMIAQNLVNVPVEAKKIGLSVPMPKLDQFVTQTRIPWSSVIDYVAIKAGAYYMRIPNPDYRGTAKHVIASKFKVAPEASEEDISAASNNMSPPRG